MNSRHNRKTISYINRIFAEQRRAFAFRGGADDFAEWAAAARAALRALIGLDKIKREIAGFKPSVSCGRPENLGEYTRQKCVLKSEPGFDVPFWFLKPRRPGPHPLALFPHGHYAERGLDYAAGVAGSAEMRRKIEEEDRDVAVQAALRGFAAIAPANRGFPPVCIPDLNSRHGNSNCRSHLMHSLLAGRTLAGERVWDLERLIDWAAGLPDINASNILMMGNSGGGGATLYAAACDERITIAVSSCAFCAFAGKNGLIHHCDCNAVPGIMGFGEFWDVAGLVAPRSLLVVHGRDDPLFPKREIERSVKRLAKIFQASGAASAFKHVYGPGGHRFYKDLMWQFITNAMRERG